jgi:hypothetical protein
MAVDSEDTERQHHRDPDIAGEERRTLERHHLAVSLGIDSRLAEYLLELHERIEKLEDRQRGLRRAQVQRPRRSVACTAPLVA